MMLAEVLYKININEMSFYKWTIKGGSNELLDLKCNKNAQINYSNWIQE